MQQAKQQENSKTLTTLVINNYSKVRRIIVNLISCKKGESHEIFSSLPSHICCTSINRTKYFCPLQAFRESAPWLVENDRGDPQKSGPCGGSNTDWGKPSYSITKAVGGQKLHLKILETVYHPGHYRVALAVNSPTELPPDPQVTTRDTDRGPWSVSAVIQNPPQIPILADGLFVHNTRPTGPMIPFETDVQLPNINCKRCTLQVVQFMAEHVFRSVDIHITTVLSWRLPLTRQNR